MSQQYNTMSQMPSQGNASWARTANGREGYARGGHAMPAGMGGPGMGGSVRGLGGGMPQPACNFPAPPPARVYCSPAAFSSLSGNRYQRIGDAYGSSVPASNYY